jgi:hypothetical protein
MSWCAPHALARKNEALRKRMADVIRRIPLNGVEVDHVKRFREAIAVNNLYANGKPAAK